MKDNEKLGYSTLMVIAVIIILFLVGVEYSQQSKVSEMLCNDGVDDIEIESVSDSIGKGRIVICK